MPHSSKSRPPIRAKLYKIHPAIGIARVGNGHPDQFFVGPETPGLPAEGVGPGTVVPPFKDFAGRIKQQGARFRVFEYEKVDGRFVPTKEMNLDDPTLERIEWQVHLANRKAAFHRFEGERGESTPPAPRRNQRMPVRELEIDPGPRQISGRLCRGVEFTPGGSDRPDRERWPRYPGPNPPEGSPVIDYLGELRTDGAGRLIVLGGRGKSASNAPEGPRPLETFANNDTWFDDVSDGPVTAVLTFKGKGGRGRVSIKAEGAWVLVGPPDFAPHIMSAVSLFDVLYDLAARGSGLPRHWAVNGGALGRLRRLNRLLKSHKGRSLAGYRPDFNDEIYPILERAINIRWVYGPAKSAHAKMGVGELPHGHMGDAHDHGVSLHVGGTESSVWPVLSDPGPKGRKVRAFVFAALRPPEGFKLPAGGMGDMPRLFGDEPYQEGHPRSRLTLTVTQYLLLRLWRDGSFTKPKTTLPPPLPAAAISPEGLDQAALENCTGGAFYPGMEVGWQVRNPELFKEPFRIDHRAKSGYHGESGVLRAGHFSRQMAVPWQADFNECTTEGEGEEEFGWWPSQRPTDVFQSADDVDAATVSAWARSSPHHRWPRGGELPTDDEMAEHWYQLGYVLKRGLAYLETERGDTVP